MILAGQSANAAQRSSRAPALLHQPRHDEPARRRAGGDVARFSGNAGFAATSVQAVDVGNGQSDKVVVDGTAILSGSLAVTKAGGYQVGTRYIVLMATGGLNVATRRSRAMSGRSPRSSAWSMPTTPTTPISTSPRRHAAARRRRR